MYIIDKNSDYYDYYSHIYGVDKKVVYDRRGSTIVQDDQELVQLSNIYHDEYLPPLHSSRFIKRDPITYLLLEIGYVQYLIQLDNFEVVEEEYTTFPSDIKYTFNCDIVREFKDNKHHFNHPVSIRGVALEYYWKGMNRKYKLNESFEEAIARISNNSIDNPILANTFITKLLDSETIWKELQNYISSLNNDKDSGTIMSDVERAEIHGFDRKTSFRNPIK